MKKNKIKSSQKKKIFAKLKLFVILSFLPILFFLMVITSKIALGPFYLPKNKDPDYAYLLNSISLLQAGTKIKHVDHPGTTMHLWTALVFKIWYNLPFSYHDDWIVTSVLRDPETYLMIVMLSTNFLLAISLFIFALIIYLITQDIQLALIGQSCIFLVHNSFSFLSHVAPEQILLSIVFLITALIIWMFFSSNWEKISIYNKITIYNQIAYLFKDKFKPKKSTVFIEFFINGITILLGFLAGLGVVSKLTFFPIFFLIFWRLKKISYWITTLFTTLVTIYFATIPIHYRWVYIKGWISALFFASEQYGYGSKTIIALPEMKENAGFFLKAEPFFLLVLLLTFLTLIYFFKKRKKKNQFYTFLLGLFLTQLISLFFVIKHYSSRYILPVIPLSGAILVIILYLTKQDFPKLKNKFFILYFLILTVKTIIFFDQQFIKINKLSPLSEEAEELEIKRAIDFGLIFADKKNKYVLNKVFGDYFPIEDKK
ncbi:MAG: hypothetical protein PVJ09_05520 [Candidatus Woesebacteria bacterium]|jgi:hypothetical protein